MILKEEEIDRKLFCGFIRHQVVDQCLRRENNKWVVRSDPFVDDWTEEDYQTLIGCLRNTAHTDGFVYGAFLNDVLKGFVSVERADPFVDDWTEEDYQTLIGCLRNTAHTDGFVYGAFLNDVLKGFVSVERGFFFVDDWTEEDYQTLIGCLRNTAHTDGFVYGAFLNDVLKGFVSVERGFFCGEKELEKNCFLQLQNGQENKGQKNYISHLIPLWKARHFIIQWAVWMPLNITRSMWKKNHMQNGQENKGQKNYISHLIPLWKARHFIIQWAVWMPLNITRSMWKKNHMIGSSGILSFNGLCGCR